MLFSMVFSLILIYTFIPFFNEFTSKSIDLLAQIPTVILILFSFSTFIGVLAGLYPSFYISGINPLKALKSRQSSKFSTRITRPLVVFQFAISCFLIICSIIMLQQMNFIATKDLGYKKEQVLVISTNTGWNDEGEKLLNRFKIEGLNNNAVLGVSGTSSSFNRGWSRTRYESDGEMHGA